MIIHHDNPGFYNKHKRDEFRERNSQNKSKALIYRSPLQNDKWKIENKQRTDQVQNVRRDGTRRRVKMHAFEGLKRPVFMLNISIEQ